MKKVLLLLFVVFIAFVLINRQRLFLRDPLASVTINDVIQDHTRVYINYSNEVLLEHTEAPVTLTVVQRGQHLGTPAYLRCLRWMGCLTDGNPASLVETMKGPVGEMTGKMVSFTDDAGRVVNVKLR